MQRPAVESSNGMNLLWRITCLNSSSIKLQRCRGLQQALTNEDVRISVSEVVLIIGIRRSSACS